mgnify:CR=1 FL=1
MLLVLFVASGCSALIYEIVWLQLLQLSIGSSAVSLGVLLGTFMGGMCLGSIALPRFVCRRRHPLRVYALIELGIGIFAIAILFGMPYLDRLYAAIAGHGLPGILLRGAVCAVCLLPPTLLMGASLPAMARWIETTPRGVSWLGFFYGGNIAGAVLGCLLAGFYLLRVHDAVTATLAAAAVNGAVAMIAFGLAAALPHHAPSGGPIEDRAARAPGAWLVLAAIALSGLCALGAEVVWTRLLSLMLGPTVYTFSIILAVFLAGLGIGSSAGAHLSRRIARPRIALGVCQMLLTAAIAWTAYVIARPLPYWRIKPSLSDLWFRSLIDVAHCLWAILPATCLWGASFPLALAAVARRGQDPGLLVGRVYAANTAGAIVGAIAVSMVAIPGVGTQQSQRLLIGLSAVAAILALAPLLLTGRAEQRWTARLRGAAFLLVSMMTAALLVWNVPAVPWGVVAYGRQLPTRTLVGDLLYLGEGMNASIVISDLYKTLRFHVSGKVEASSDQQDMRLQRMLGHIPALLHPKPRSALVVGCGAGVTAGSFVVHPEVERIVICEIEALIPPAAAWYFGRENHDVLRDRRTEVVYDDARHFIRTTRETFDIITSDPIHPWVKGSATLYTREYFELCKRHLNSGGFITQWVPLYESSLETVKSEIATFLEVFPSGTIWGNETAFEEGYDLVLLGQAGAARIDVDELQRRLERPDHALVAKSLRELGFGSTLHLLATYAGRGRDLQPWLRHAQINRDRNLRLQYLAGMGLNSQGAIFIYEEMLRHRRFPEELFAGSSQHAEALRRALGQRPPSR